MSASRSGHSAMSPRIEAGAKSAPRGMRRSAAITLAGRYAVALLVVAAVLAVRLVLEGQFGWARTIMFPLVAVLLAALLGGWGPGLFALLLSCFLYGRWVHPPAGSPALDLHSDVGYLLTFTLVGGVMAIIGASARALRRRAMTVRDQMVAQARLLDLINNPVIVRDADDGITYWNQAAATTYGYRSEEAWGRKIHDLLQTQFPEPREEIEAALRRWGRWSGEIIHRHKDGAPVVVMSRWVLDSGPQGAPASILETNHDITDRKRTEAQLRESEDRYRAVLDSQIEMLCRFRADGTILFVNRAYARSRGVPREKLAGANLWDFIPEADRGAVRQMLDALTPAAPEVRIENRFETAEGVRWVLWSNRALEFDAAGRWVEAQSAGIDITDRRRAEEQLQVSRDTFFALIENAPFGVYVVDAQFRMAQVSAGSRHAFRGVDPLLGRDFGEVLRCIWPDNFAAAVEARFRHTLKTGEAYVAPDSTEVREDSRSVESYDWRIERLRLPDGQCGVVCYFYDITARKRAEAGLVESEERFRSLVSVLADVPWTCDVEGRMVSPQPAWEQFTGQSWEQYRGTGWRAAVHPDDRPQLEAQWNRGAKGDGKIHASFRLWKAAAQQHRHVTARGTPLRDPDGRIREWVGACTDIHEQQLAAEKLEGLVADRTEALQDKLGELEAFSYSVSHDIRGPLRTMQGFASALLEGYGDKLDENGRDYLRRIDRGAQRLDLLVRDVLAYSKLAKGQFKLESIELGGFLQELVEGREFAPDIVELVEPLPAVRAHQALLAQIFSNLLENAVKFARPGVPPRVWIRGEQRGGMVRVWVEDNGLGIAPQHFGRIFEIFGRVHGDGRFDGTGIGLAIVKKAAERLGGSVGVESEVGRGSRFWVELESVAEN